MQSRQSRPIQGPSALWLVTLAFLAALGPILAWISSGYVGAGDWPSFFVILLVAAGLLLLGWRLLRAENPPGALAGILVGAALLRLVAGVFWYSALPVIGHGTPEEHAGYVMADAATRDQAAWELATSGKPLLRAFRSPPQADQYGGMLFLSAFVYRILWAETHHPLLIVMLTSAFSALAVPFAWAFCRRAWDTRVGMTAALFLAVYPEAVLLGSSQMREAFFIPLAAAALYGLARYITEHARVGLLWVGLAIVLMLPLSPPFAAMLVPALALVGMGLWLEYDMGRKRPGAVRSPRLWLAVILALLVAFTILYLALRQFAPEDTQSPLAVFSWWLRKAAGLQAHLMESGSGWVQRIFDSTPEWSHPYLLLLYGIAQPFLPAALLKPSAAPVWQIIAIWRSLGWTFLLILLVYAPLRAFRSGGSRTARFLSVASWLIVLTAAYRGGGDQWDNPRYRAAFAVFQVTLAAWAWASSERREDRLLARLGTGLAAVLAWFLPWYLRRQYQIDWPVVDVFKTFALGLASAVLLIFADWARHRKM